jgi:hypothetical protein
VVAAEPVRQAARLSAARWRSPLGGLAAAASVAAAAILWVRFESLPQDGRTVGQAVPATAGSGTVGSGGPIAAATNSPESYVVPKSIPRRSIVPSTQLANYVVAHSEFSSPVNRRNLLSALMANESGTAGVPSGSEEPTEDVNDDAKSPQ